MNAQVRKFETGATRSADAGRYDPEGFLSPIALERYCEYMNKHRLQPDGSIRSSDNWQKGIPLDAYAKGGWRHWLHFWARHRGYQVADPGATANIEEDLCALMFNIQGYLHELVKARQASTSPQFAFTIVDEIPLTPGDHDEATAVQKMHERVESTYAEAGGLPSCERRDEDEIWDRRHKSWENENG